jgi:hypothetical protein
LGEDIKTDEQRMHTDEVVSQMRSYMGGGIVLGIIAFVYLVCLCWGYRSLKLAIDVVDASADFVVKTKRIILVPIFYFIITIAVIVVWLGQMALVVSMNEIRAGKGIQEREVIWDQDVVWLSLLMGFGLIWWISWLEYSSTFVIMVSAASYYFDSNAEREGSANVGLGFYMTYFNHPGSIALGGLTISVVRVIKLLFYFVAR